MQTTRCSHLAIGQKGNEGALSMRRTAEMSKVRAHGTHAAAQWNGMVGLKAQLLLTAVAVSTSSRKPKHELDGGN